VPCALAALSPSKKQKILEKAHHVEYVGDQRDWPRSERPVAKLFNNKYGVPIYESLPNKSYEILGVIQTTGSSAVKRAAEAAQAVGADAILACGHEAFSKAGISVKPNIAFRGSKPGKIELLQGILIRWRR